METVNDGGEKDKQEEYSSVRVTKMGKWESKLETEMGPWHNLLDRQDIRDIGSAGSCFFTKNWKKQKIAETEDVLTLNKCL